jgi:uncharacterized protein DUF6781
MPQDPQSPSARSCLTPEDAPAAPAPEIPTALPSELPPTALPPGDDTIRQEASESLRGGFDIRARVRDVTILALKSRRFDRHGIRAVVGAVTDGLALGAEQSRGELRQALAEAFRGLDDALTRSAESGRTALRQLVATGKDYSDTDFKQTLATMKQLEDDFLSTAAHAAERASEKVQPELRQLIDTARMTGTDTGKAVASTFTELGQRFSAAWLDVALASVELASEVGTRFAQVTGGVLSGIADALSERRPVTKRP